MSLLELERVTKRFGRGSQELTVLSEISLQIEAGELVAIWGMRRSGRSTLLRIAAGVTAPDSGVVRFEGHDLAGRDADLHRGGIGYCRMTQRPAEGEIVLEQLVTDQLARGIASRTAESRARSALERTGAERCAAASLKELDAAELVRVAISGALTQRPKLLLVDEPTLGLERLRRDELLLLLRSLADEGIAALTTTGPGDGPCLSAANRALALEDGKLVGSLAPALAPVVPLRRPA